MQKASPTPLFMAILQPQLTVVRMHLSPIRFCILLLAFSFIFTTTKLVAQCISSFPYSEDFEVSNGGWTPGGTASDWTWGTPTKQKISKAGSGSKCWLTGTLSGNSYNDNEASWLQSPCFDFTNIKMPYLSFLVNWDSELGYDGAALQYRSDNNAPWTSVGAYNEASDCLNNNWYNAGDIRYGLQSDGWSGSSSNSSTDGWLLAQHTLPFLAGKKNVSFRFVFGAGKIENNFNGFAFDKITIGEAPGNGEFSFVSSCDGVNTISFLPSQIACITSKTWDFGDPASGSANVADGSEEATHVFSSTGNYIITLTGIDNTNTIVTARQFVAIENIIASVQKPILCAGQSGIITASLSNGNDNDAQFMWNTTPVTTTSSATTKAGSYTVTATLPYGCINPTSVTLPEPAPLVQTVETVQPGCSNNNGEITITTNGGIAPYMYSWQPSASQTATATGLSAGTYATTVKDNNGCENLLTTLLAIPPSGMSHTVTVEAPECGLADGSIHIIASGGSGNYTYQWTPAISNTNEGINISDGDYTVVISDEKGCKDTATLQLQSLPLTVSLGNDTTVCKGQVVLLKPDSVYSSYLWEDGSTLPTRQVAKAGTYTLQVMNEGGCVAKDTIRVLEGCGDLQFPSAFTPNGDGRNDEYGPSGGVSFVKHYRLLIYDRTGGLLFQSSNPYQRWNGLSNRGVKISGTCVYMATYEYDGAQKLKKGTLTLLQ